MIDIPSVTVKAVLSSFLASYLSSLGYAVELQPVEGKRANLLATTAAAPRIVFSTHLDTVPTYIPSSEDAENIYGRGACDAKGIIASQIFAAERLRAGGFLEVGLLFTAMRNASAGAVSPTNTPANYCHYLSGEPTDTLLAIVPRALCVSITTTGERRLLLPDRVNRQ